MLSFQGRSGRRAFLAVWAVATALLIPVGAGAVQVMQAARQWGAADTQLAMLAAALILLGVMGYLFPLLAASVRRARDLGASALVLGLVVGVELAGLAARAWAVGDVFWLFGLFDGAVFLTLALWPGLPEGDAQPAWALA
ncbi:DUF805 domain-containing protein [Caulobacter sp. 17J65-9]|uniref:DUF805 domain-containing protein n=1 Tax=Caulobacter sp. 17J65-9 TaxID=2709382 RepID=UPI0013CBA32D|nr:DUF805 domain-containing protein [Caulobacter sp. 17J65-9]